MSRPGRAWLAVAALLVALSVAASVLLGDPNAASRWMWHAYEPWEPLRWWTAAVVHHGPWHLAANVGAAAAVAAWGWAARVGSRDAAAWLVSWPLSQALLVTDPGSLADYAGLSATLHAGVAIGCWHLTVHRRGAAQAVGLAVGVAVLLKLLLESPWFLAAGQGVPVHEVVSAPLPGAPGHVVAGHAHACGVAAGLIASAVLDGMMTLKPRMPP